MPNFKNDGNTAAVFSKNDGGGQGVFGFSTGAANGFGGTTGYGVVGILRADPNIFSFSIAGAGVIGLSDAADGIVGVSSVGAGVRGIASGEIPGGIPPFNQGVGVIGECAHAGSNMGTGVLGAGGGVGVSGIGHDIGVNGFSMVGSGVVGGSGGAGTGVAGSSAEGHGVQGTNGTLDGRPNGPDKGCGILGESANGFGVFGSSENHFAIKAVSKNGVGLSAEGKRLAAFFRGNVEVRNGDIVLTDGADCAEDFDVLDDAAVGPGTVMVIGDLDDVLKQSSQAYDKRVAGVISGGGNFKPAITLDKQHSKEHRLPVALLGKVYCKVDAGYAPVEIGDLLTTSPTRGHAMKAIDQTKAFGAVIGKALRSLSEGQGLIPVLVALQ
jgi:hypothetical protein